MNNLLFVYGTLLAADTGTTGRSQRTRLARASRIVGQATLPGHLYDLGRYPALVIIGDLHRRPAPSTSAKPDISRHAADVGLPPDQSVRGQHRPTARFSEAADQDGTASLVHGELLELADPARSLAWLDAYEGIVPGPHPHNDYERIERTVTLTDGATASAWVYVWRAALGPATLIPGGRWLSR